MFSLLQIIWSVVLILGGLSLQWPEAGSPFLARDGGWPAESAAARPALESLTTRPPEPVARPWPVSCVQMNFHIEMESGETSQVFTRRKRVRGHTGGLRGSCPRGGFETLLWGISSGFPLANYLAFPGSESVSGISQGPPMCPCASLSQAGF